MLELYQVQIHFQNGGQLTYNKVLCQPPQSWVSEMLEQTDGIYIDTDSNDRAVFVNLDHVTAILIQKIEEEESTDEKIKRDI